MNSGMGDPYVISAAHGDGVIDLVDEALDEAFATASADEAEELRTSTTAASRSPSSAVRTSASRRWSTRCSAKSA